MGFLKSKYTFAFLGSLVFLSGCVNIGGKMADVLSTSVLNQRDPEIIREGLPAYLLLLDGLLHDDPENSQMLLAGAKLYSAYASAFVNEEPRAQSMSTTAMEYANRAICIELNSLCDASNKSLDKINSALGAIDNRSEASILFGYASVWAGWIQANSGDWKAIADLPKVESILRKVLVLDETFEQGGAHLYMGVLLCLRPASLGGQPEQGKEHFERAIELSEGRNLMAKVLYARHYARLTFDQALHDSLLAEVIASDINQRDLVLINVLAQKQAQELLKSSNDYF